MRASPYARIGATLVDNGYSAIPCMPGTKRPGDYRGKWYGRMDWQRYGDRLPTEHETEAWNMWPDAGVCLVMDQYLKVIDIDTDDPAILSALADILPDSPVKKRGQKGFSAFYRGSPIIKAKSYNLGPERVVDLIAYGRQTVIPPTIHPDTGKPYEWCGEDNLERVTPDMLPVLDDNIDEAIAAALKPFGYMPEPERAERGPAQGDNAFREINDLALRRLDDWVPGLGLERCKRGRDGYRSVASFRPSGSGKPMDKRNVHLSINKKGIVDWGDGDRTYTPIDLCMVALPATFDDATSWLRDKLGVKSDPDRFSALIRNGLAKHKPLAIPPPIEEDEDDGSLALTDITKLRRDLLSRAGQLVSTPIAAPAGEINPFDHRTQGGVLSAITRWMLDSAWRPVPEFATLGALGVCSALFGRRYVTPTGLGLNLYMIGLGGAGFGKDHPLKALQALLADAGMTYLIGPADFSSDSALEHVIRTRAVFTMPMDEIGMFFQGVSGRNSGGFEKRIRKILLELYTRSDGIWTGKQKTPVTGAKVVHDTSAEPIYNPTVSIVGMSTPTEFYEGITEQNLKDGVVARMTVVAPARRPKSRKERLPVVPPGSLVAELKKAAAEYPQTGNLADANWRTPTARPRLHHARWESDAVRDKWLAVEEWQTSVIDEDPTKDGVMSRSAEQTLKLATIRAISRNTMNPIITDADIEWGWAVVSVSLDVIDEGVAKHMAGDPFEKLCKDILLHVEAAGGEIPKSVLLRKKGLTKDLRVISSAMAHLAEAGRIYPVPAGGRVTITLKKEAA